MSSWRDTLMRVNNSKRKNGRIVDYYCKDCIYLHCNAAVRCCEYILITGKRRPCQAGEGCIVRVLKWDKDKQNEEQVAVVSAVEHEEKCANVETEALRQEEQTTQFIDVFDCEDKFVPSARYISWDEEKAWRLTKENKTNQEIADAVGTTKEAIKSWKKRRRAKKRKALASGRNDKDRRRFQ